MKYRQIWWVPEPAEWEDSSTTLRLIFALKEMGIEVVCDKYKPFGVMDYSFLTSRNCPIVFYGSLATVKDVQRRKIKLSPFAWCNFDDLSCMTYYSWWGKHLLQQRYAFYPVSEIHRNADFIYDVYGKDGCLFIRPNDNFKSFTGEVVKKDLLSGFCGYIEHTCGPNCPCVVSRPEQILHEYRLVINEEKVIAGSQYKEGTLYQPDPFFPDDAAVFAEEITKETQCTYSPHPVYVMDIALTPDGYKLLEIGSINCAGLYECDVRKVVKAISDLIIENNQTESEPC